MSLEEGGDGVLGERGRKEIYLSFTVNVLQKVYVTYLKFFSFQ